MINDMTSAIRGARNRVSGAANSPKLTQIHTNYADVINNFPYSDGILYIFMKMTFPIPESVWSLQNI